jgi:biopolymer transport protein ExbB/TolQ
MRSFFWSLISQSDGTTKLIVYTLMLVVFAIFVIFAYTLTKLNNKKNDSKAIINKLRNGKKIDKIYGHKFANFIVLLIEKFTLKSKEEYEILLESATLSYLQREKFFITFLATAASVAPLVGLFGTVWGIIHAFSGISASGITDISAIAPGIAEALITTLLGLIVAIPSLIFHNILYTLYKETILVFSQINFYVSNSK